MFFLGESVTLDQVQSSPTVVSDWLGNPPGSNTRHVGARYSILDKLQERFINEIINKPEKFRQLKVDVYKTKEENIFDIHVRIPSLTVNNFTYDVLFRVGFLNNVRNIKQANILVFTNSPSWVFTYAYICNKYNVMHPLCKKALPSEVLNSPPKKVNPDEHFGFDRVITFGLYFLTMPNLPTNNLNGIKALAKSKILTELDIKNLFNFERVFAERQHLEQVQHATIAKEQKKMKQDKKNIQLQASKKMSSLFKLDRDETLFKMKKD